ncbi:MAG: nucleotidyl transferase AbiEii/AbiGii toxin family protein [Bacteroidaceae bacterium]|nr:nucleotidyl transferase AbiEii/AbiGii toxin family protein [Bacteroidaceae bacterium]
MAQILSLIFKDKDLCNALGFKGGTALMFFHNLPRFSTDLDLNLLNADKLDVVYAKVRNILVRFGTIGVGKVSAP